eukprot:Rmarinus@m.13975
MTSHPDASTEGMVSAPDSAAPEAEGSARTANSVTIAGASMEPGGVRRRSTTRTVPDENAGSGLGGSGRISPPVSAGERNSLHESTSAVLPTEGIPLGEADTVPDPILGGGHPTGTVPNMMVVPPIDSFRSTGSQGGYTDASSIPPLSPGTPAASNGIPPLSPGPVPSESAGAHLPTLNPGPVSNSVDNGGRWDPSGTSTLPFGGDNKDVVDTTGHDGTQASAVGAKSDVGNIPTETSTPQQHRVQSAPSTSQHARRPSIASSADALSVLESITGRAASDAAGPAVTAAVAATSSVPHSAVTTAPTKLPSDVVSGEKTVSPHEYQVAFEKPQPTNHASGHQRSARQRTPTDSPRRQLSQPSPAQGTDTIPFGVQAENPPTQIQDRGDAHESFVPYLPSSDHTRENNVAGPTNPALAAEMAKQAQDFDPDTMEQVFEMLVRHPEEAGALGGLLQWAYLELMNIRTMFYDVEAKYKVKARENEIGIRMMRQLESRLMQHGEVGNDVQEGFQGEQDRCLTCVMLSKRESVEMRCNRCLELDRMRLELHEKAKEGVDGISVPPTLGATSMGVIDQLRSRIEEYKEKIGKKDQELRREKDRTAMLGELMKQIGTTAQAEGTEDGTLAKARETLAVLKEQVQDHALEAEVERERSMQLQKQVDDLKFRIAEMTRAVAERNMIEEKLEARNEECQMEKRLGAKLRAELVMMTTLKENLERETEQLKKRELETHLDRVRLADAKCEIAGQREEISRYRAQIVTLESRCRTMEEKDKDAFAPSHRDAIQQISKQAREIQSLTSFNAELKAEIASTKASLTEAKASLVEEQTRVRQLRVQLEESVPGSRQEIVQRMKDAEMEADRFRNLHIEAQTRIGEMRGETANLKLQVAEFKSQLLDKCREQVSDADLRTRYVEMQGRLHEAQTHAEQAKQMTVDLESEKHKCDALEARLSEAHAETVSLRQQLEVHRQRAEMVEEREKLREHELTDSLARLRVSELNQQQISALREDVEYYKRRADSLAGSMAGEGEFRRLYFDELDKLREEVERYRQRCEELSGIEAELAIYKARAALRKGKKDGSGDAEDGDGKEHAHAGGEGAADGQTEAAAVGEEETDEGPVTRVDTRELDNLKDALEAKNVSYDMLKKELAEVKQNYQKARSELRVAKLRSGFDHAKAGRLQNVNDQSDQTLKSINEQLVDAEEAMVKLRTELEETNTKLLQTEEKLTSTQDHLDMYTAVGTVKDVETLASDLDFCKGRLDRMAKDLREAELATQKERMRATKRKEAHERTKQLYADAKAEVERLRSFVQDLQSKVQELEQMKADGTLARRRLNKENMPERMLQRGIMPSSATASWQ